MFFLIFSNVGDIGKNPNFPVCFVTTKYGGKFRGGSEELFLHALLLEMLTLKVCIYPFLSNVEVSKLPLLSKKAESKSKD